MKKIIEFTVRMEIDDQNLIDIDIIDLDEHSVNDVAPKIDPGITTFSVEGGDFISNIAYHGSEEEWYITYKS